MKISAIALGLLLITGLVWYSRAGAAVYSRFLAMGTTITVTTTANTAANDGVCSLREAITAANTNTVSGAAAGECAAGMAGMDTIVFNIGVGTPMINVTSTLPTITEPVIIDGNTGGATRVELNGAGGGVNGLTITAGNSTIKSLVINRFSQTGILINTNGGNIIQNCFIGTNAAGTVDLGNSINGIVLNDGANNTIGGIAAGTGNVISGNNQDGILIGSGSTNNIVQGNFIGTDVNGITALGNSSQGVNILTSVSGNTIGGSTTGARNIVSGNGDNGVRIGVGSSNNTVLGNFIGTNAVGTAAIPNLSRGVSINSAPSNTVGGAATGARNVISGNGQEGVFITGSLATGNAVQGNYIGTNAAGTAALGNGADGVIIDSSSTGNTIGGASAAARNIISGNGQEGVRINGSSTTGNMVQGNYIGTNAAGTAALGNGGRGVAVFNGANNTSILNNLVSGQMLHGVDIAFGTSNCIVRGNLIGTNAAGTAAIGNGATGVLINLSSNNNTVGGTTASDRNIISANSGGGVGIGESSTG
ncbi:MAG: right-handed parallel beta-helix repeat-containing protein, partial [Acidobacteriota bacterium]